MDSIERNISVSGKLNDYFATIADIRGRIFSSLSYAKRDNLIFNKMYFGDEVPTKKLIEGNYIIIDNIIERLGGLKEEIVHEEIFNDNQVKLLLDYLNSVVDEMNYHRVIMSIEAAKAGYQDYDCVSSVSGKLKQKNELETRLYGPSLLEYPQRLDNVKHKLASVTSNEAAMGRLSLSERNMWRKLLGPLLQDVDLRENDHDAYNSSLDLDLLASMSVGEDSVVEVLSLALQLEGILPNDLILIDVKSDISEPICSDEGDDSSPCRYTFPGSYSIEDIYDYMETLPNSGMNDKFKLIKPLIGNASVEIVKSGVSSWSKRHFRIRPSVDGKYSLLDLCTVFLDHELNHVKTNTNNALGYNISSHNRGSLEEGVTLLGQALSTGHTLEDFLGEARRGDIKQFIGEKFDEHDGQQLLYLYQKILGKSSSYAQKKAETDIMRLKLGVPFGELGSRRKDMIYGDGQELVRQITESLLDDDVGIDSIKKHAATFYNTRLGFSYLNDVDAILENIGHLPTIENSDYPYFVGKIILWKLLKGKVDKDNMLKNDIRSLIASPKNMSHSKKRLLIEMVNIIQSDEFYSQEH